MTLYCFIFIINDCKHSRNCVDAQEDYCYFEAESKEGKNVNFLGKSLFFRIETLEQGKVYRKKLELLGPDQSYDGIYFSILSCRMLSGWSSYTYDGTFECSGKRLFVCHFAT